jgi:hypothetical protein
MKDRRPQFMRMNAGREENPPLREVGCPEYRSCLNEAAYNNLCLDCSQCALGQAPEQPALQDRPPPRTRQKSPPAAPACRC